MMGLNQRRLGSVILVPGNVEGTKSARTSYLVHRTTASVAAAAAAAAAQQQLHAVNIAVRVSSSCSIWNVFVLSTNSSMILVDTTCPTKTHNANHSGVQLRYKRETCLRLGWRLLQL